MNTYNDILIKNVLIPIFKREALYDIYIQAGKIFSVEAAKDSCSNTQATKIIDCAAQHIELWPGFVESHTHLALPTNFDETLESAAIITLQYHYFGVTHVVDMFGFPAVAREWQELKRNSNPLINIAHCGYALTAPEEDGKIGHGSEYPVPIHVIHSVADILPAIDANRALGATFLKIMYSSGIEKPGDERRFTLLKRMIFQKILEIAEKEGLLCVVDCNTLEEVQYATQCGYRYFAHPVRDFILTTEDWDKLSSCYFITTLQGLKPLVMTGVEMTAANNSEHFFNTQLKGREKFFASITEPYGVQRNMQESRLHALDCMYKNSVAALKRGQGLIGTDSGNTLAYHGFSYYQELQTLFTNKTIDRQLLLETASYKGRAFFDRVSKKETDHFLALDSEACLNLIPAGSLLPSVSIIKNNLFSSGIIAEEITRINNATITK